MNQAPAVTLFRRVIGQEAPAEGQVMYLIKIFLDFLTC